VEYLAQFSGVESSKFISDIYSALNVNQKISSVRQVITFGRVTPLTMEQYAARFFIFISLYINPMSYCQSQTREAL